MKEDCINVGSVSAQEECSKIIPFPPKDNVLRALITPHLHRRIRQIKKTKTNRDSLSVSALKERIQINIAKSD